MREQRRTSALSPEEIRAHWSHQVSRYGLDPASSWSDLRAIQLEVETISRFLTPGLEVRERLDFRLGDVRSLEFAPRSFDRVISTRVVINLSSREEQRRALHEFARVLRPGGVLLLSEPTMQGWQRLNALRGEWDLPPMGMPAHNVYLDEQRIREDAGPQLELETILNFSSSYFVATRVLKPLLARATSMEADIADPAAEFNRWAAQLPPAGDYGTQKLFVFRR